MPAANAVIRADLDERVGIRRSRHGLSRKVVANLVGRSEEWLRQVRIAIRMGRLEKALRLARDLHVPPDLPVDRRTGHLITHGLRVHPRSR